MKTTKFLIPLLFLSILTYGHVGQNRGGNYSQQKPVNALELSSFKARVDEGKVHLEWVTTQEVKNEFFTIERSNNGTDFIDAGTITSEENTKTTLLYDFNDEHPLHGKSFYRLKQINYDGSYTYSKIVLVMVDDPLK